MSEETDKIAKVLRESSELLSEAVADRIVGVLNEALQLDYEATVQLVFGDHIPCNEALADHSTIQVRKLDEDMHPEGRPYGVRVMGLLNGLAGTYPDGYGRVGGNFEAICKKHGVTPGEERVGDHCPEPKCGRVLELGKLLEFVRVDPALHQIPEPVGEA